MGCELGFKYPEKYKIVYTDLVYKDEPYTNKTVRDAHYEYFGLVS